MERTRAVQLIEEIARRIMAEHVAEKHPPRKKRDTPIPEGFELFWSVWTPKRGRAEAEKAWLKIQPGPLLVQEIADAAQAQIKAMGEEWTRENHKYQPRASTWLNGERWRDEIESGKKPKLVKPVVLCACGCGHEAHFLKAGRLWYLSKCWWDWRQENPVEDDK